MKPATLPAVCGAALAMMSTASFSHWLSIQELVTAVRHGLPLHTAPVLPGVPPTTSTPAAIDKPPVTPVLAARMPLAAPPPAAATDPAQQKFYESLVTRMENLQNQNRDLLNQVAETNRDMMNLNFRVDTFSDSFRPMPVGEAPVEVTFADSGDFGGPGVLPPRAEPVSLPVP
jgi:hypothetical protein